ncbi:prolyl oligopeptidase family serine peptidase [Cohnella cellulosilytica]|uniref:Prolyl oligopeptidase family serine peptidase n=1 Tax=Cohnella cellulosilytica TaxID=986710 RepID=A0ABW2F434_9BACL
MGSIYYTITEITDLGPFHTKLVLPLGARVKAAAVRPECFNVYVERKDAGGETLRLPKSWEEPEAKAPSKGYGIVRDAYPSSRSGERREEGDFVALEMKLRPFGVISPLAAPNERNEFVFCDYRITQIAEIPTEAEPLTGLVFDRCAGDTMRQAEKFLHGVSSYGEEPLKYGCFAPQTGGGRRPLIIWLHGAGEGGEDPTVAYAGNKVVHLAGDDIQAKFGGAFVLVPQVPTFWMDDGSGQYGRSGKSRYVQALKALIDEFVARNDAAIDANRIYIGGCSNGGFMTMRMVLDYPDFFAAAYPVCEALYDETVSDADIEAIKSMPIWFTHSRDDSVVKPEETAIPTYERLIKAGARNVHFSLFDRVVDLYGLFNDEGEEPFAYPGHFAWIYLFNDDCRLDYDGKPVAVDSKELSLMAWLAMQKRG